MPPARVSLAYLPTPMHRLDRLSADTGVDLWIKRDDLTGFAGGGNKGRKIEFLLAQALQEEVDLIVCQGAAQSNFIRQLGAACAMFGIECHGAIMRMPHYAAAGRPRRLGDSMGGNIVLDRLFGVHLHEFEDDDWDVLAEHAEELARSFEVKGKRVKLIQIGGSSALGAYSFELAAQELDQSEILFDAIVTASSSGSTHAGLAYHFHQTPTRVIGISADPDPEDVLAQDVVELCAGIDELLGSSKSLNRNDIDLRMEYCGEAYGIPSSQGMDAMSRFANREGILLDPIYSGKAAAGLFDLLKQGAIAGRVLFWHTGGFPTLFANGLLAT